MLKIILIITLFSILTACGSAPVMEHKVEVWNGSPEEAGICRLTPKQVGDKTTPIARYFIKSGSAQCIGAESEEFANYGAMTWDDIRVIQEYIETLINSCSKWK